MKYLPAWAICAVFWLCVGQAVAAEPVEDVSGVLERFVAKQDDAFTYRERSSMVIGDVEARELELVSQVWQGTAWRHRLILLKPKELTHPKQGLLLVVGGSWRGEEEPLFGQGRKLPKEVNMFLGTAREMGSVIAVVTRVPFQPMYEGLKEDDLIAFTMDRYLESGDTSWPLLLPMVKSAVRAMDATQAYSQETWGVEIEHFTVSGASKRGWTTWLTGATDKRVNAIVPIVIDVLNMQQQMKLHVAAWGAPSRMIRPYTERNILERFDSPRGQELIQMVDPYSYRNKLEHLLKTVLLATNDPYWPVDAANLYWDGLHGDKRLVYAPNSGHSMDRGILHVVGSVVATHIAAAEGLTLPNPTWTLSKDDTALHVDVTSQEKPTRAALWWADSNTRDFRESTWQTKPITVNGEKITSDVPRPTSGYRAAYISMTYPDLPTGFQVSTQIGVFASDAAGDPMEVGQLDD